MLQLPVALRPALGVTKPEKTKKQVPSIPYNLLYM